MAAALARLQGVRSWPEAVNWAGVQQIWKNIPEGWVSVQQPARTGPAEERKAH